MLKIPKMPGRVRLFAAVILVVIVGSGGGLARGQAPPARGQTPQAAPAPPPYQFPPGFTLQPTPEPLARAADPGVMFTTIMERPEVRILRVEIQPGGVRRTHTHEDVTFHLLMPLNGPLQVTAGSETIEARPGQAYFMKKGMPHSFTNTGKTAVTIMETFVKPEPKTAAGGSDDARSLALALAAQSGTQR